MASCIKNCCACLCDDLDDYEEVQNNPRGKDPNSSGGNSWAKVSTVFENMFSGGGYTSNNPSVGVLGGAQSTGSLLDSADKNAN